MTPFTCLIPLDGSAFSQEIVPTVCRFLSPDKYAVTLLCVGEEPASTPAECEVPVDDRLMLVYPPSTTVVRSRPPVYRSQVWETSQSLLQDQLVPVQRELEAAGFDVSVVVRFGKPDEEIVKYAVEAKVDLVAMSTHGRTGLRRLVLGSVAERVLRRLSIPVLALRPFASALSSPTLVSR